MKALDQTKPLHVILHHLFDYAGMFPPAALSFDDALSESAHHATTLAHPWLVGTDLVLDTAHARLLAEHDLSKFGFLAPPRTSILVTEGASAALLAAKSLTTCSSPSNAQVVGFEAKVSAETFPILVKELGNYIRETGASLALEPDLSVPNWRNNLVDIVAEITKSPFIKQLSLKCRCTGPTGINPDRLATAIATAADAGIGFKVTGGLHHPFVEPSIHPFPMGFLNVTVAVYLRRIVGAELAEPDIIALLINSCFDGISFTNGIRFGRFSVTPQQIATAKERLPFSIGSCSIREPDADLVRLLYSSN